MAEEKRFVKAYDFEMYRDNLYNGSIEMLIPNLPDIFDKYHVEVKVYGLVDIEEKPEEIFMGIVQEEIPEKPKVIIPNYSSSDGLSQETINKFKRSRRH